MFSVRPGPVVLELYLYIDILAYFPTNHCIHHIQFYSSLPSDFFDSGKKEGKATSTGQPIKSILVNSTKPILSQYGSDSEEDEEEMPVSSTSSIIPSKLESSGVPSGKTYMEVKY